MIYEAEYDKRISFDYGSSSAKQLIVVKPDIIDTGGGRRMRSVNLHADQARRLLTSR